MKTNKGSQNCLKVYQDVGFVSKSILWCGLLKSTEYCWIKIF